MKKQIGKRRKVVSILLLLFASSFASILLVEPEIPIVHAFGSSWYSNKTKYGIQTTFVNETSYVLEIYNGSLHTSGGSGGKAFRLNYTRSTAKDYCSNSIGNGCFWEEYNDGGGDGAKVWKVVYADANVLWLNGTHSVSSFDDVQNLIFWHNQDWFYWSLRETQKTTLAVSQWQTGISWDTTVSTNKANLRIDGTVAADATTPASAPSFYYQSKFFWFGIKDSTKALNSSIGWLVLWTKPPYLDASNCGTGGGNECQLSSPFDNPPSGNQYRYNPGWKFSYGTVVYPFYGDQPTGTSPPWYTPIQTLSKQLFAVGFGPKLAMGNLALGSTSCSSGGTAACGLSNRVAWWDMDSSNNHGLSIYNSSNIRLAQGANAPPGPVYFRSDSCFPYIGIRIVNATGSFCLVSGTNSIGRIFGSTFYSGWTGTPAHHVWNYTTKTFSDSDKFIFLLKDRITSSTSITQEFQQLNFVTLFGQTPTVTKLNNTAYSFVYRDIPTAVTGSPNNQISIVLYYRSSDFNGSQVTFPVTGGNRTVTVYFYKTATPQIYTTGTIAINLRMWTAFGSITTASQITNLHNTFPSISVKESYSLPLSNVTSPNRTPLVSFQDLQTTTIVPSHINKPSSSSWRTNLIGSVTGSKTLYVIWNRTLAGGSVSSITGATLNSVTSLSSQLDNVSYTASLTLGSVTTVTFKLGISLVQTKNCIFTSLSSLTCTFASNVPIDDVSVVGVETSINTNTITSVTDSASNTYNLVTSFAVLSAVGLNAVYCSNVGSAGTLVVTVNFGAASTGVIILYDLANAVASCAGTGSDDSVGSNALSSSPSVGSYTPSQTGFEIGFLNSGCNVACTVSAGGGYTKDNDIAITAALKATSESIANSATATTTPFSLSASSAWSEISVTFVIAAETTVTLPLTCTMSNSAPQQTLTLDGASASPTTLLCDASSHNITVDKSSTLTILIPIDATNTRARFKQGSSVTAALTWSVVTCSSGTCAGASNTTFYQLRNLYQATPVGPSVWDAAYTINVKGTVLGTASTNCGTVVTTTGGGATSNNLWCDYNLQVTMDPTFGSTWTNFGPNTFTQTIGGNTDNVNYTFTAANMTLPGIMAVGIILAFLLVWLIAKRR